MNISFSFDEGGITDKLSTEELEGSIVVSKVGDRKSIADAVEWTVDRSSNNRSTGVWRQTVFGRSSGMRLKTPVKII